MPLENQQNYWVLTLKTYYGVGYHVVGYLLMLAAQYYAHFQVPRRPFVRAGFFVRHFAALPGFAAIKAAWEAGRPAAGHDNPLELDLDTMPFRSEDYVAANPDVALVPIPFLHFLDRGYGEERPIDGTAAGAAELADRIIVLRDSMAKSLARQRKYADWSMEWGRYHAATRLWDEYLVLCPDDREAYDLAVIAYLNARIPPDDIIAKAAARFPDHPAFR